MTLTDQNKLLTTIEKYNNTNSKLIQINIAKHIKESKYTSKQIAELISILKNISKSTVDSWRNLKRNMKIDFETALRVAEVLEIGIEDLMEE